MPSQSNNMKTLFAIALALLVPFVAGASAIPGTVVSAKVTTGNTGNTFPIGDTSEMAGTPKQVADATARDAIPAERRTQGMECWVVGEGKKYRLVGGIANGDWVDVTENITRAVNVLNLGATGNGTSYDTAAFQAALDSGHDVFVPGNGRYLLGNLTGTNTMRIFGEGQSSVLLRATTNVGPLLNLTAPNCTVDHLRFDGNTNGLLYNPRDQHSDAGTLGAAHGILLNAVGHPRVVFNDFVNFSGYAIMPSGDGDMDARKNAYLIQFNAITNCETGVLIPGGNTGEYGQVIGNQLHNCFIAVDVQSANCDVLDNQIHDANRGVYAHPDNGRSHSRIENNTLNHCVYPLYITNAQHGLTIVGNNILAAGYVRIEGASDGVIVQDNYFELVGGLEDFSTGTNIFRLNVFTLDSFQGNVSTHLFGCTNLTDALNSQIGVGYICLNVNGQKPQLTGAAIVDGTINSNKLDAATRAMLGGGGGGSNDGNSTNFWGRLSPTNLPSGLAGSGTGSVAYATSSINSTQYWGKLNNTNMPDVLNIGSGTTGVVGGGTNVDALTIGLGAATFDNYVGVSISNLTLRGSLLFGGIAWRWFNTSSNALVLNGETPENPQYKFDYDDNGISGFHAPKLYGIITTNSFTGAPVTGYVPTKQADGTIAWAAGGTSSGPITGVTDGSAAAAGIVGERIKKTVAAVNAGTVGEFFDVTNMVLSAGDWEVQTSAYYQNNSALYTVLQLIAGVSLTSGNSYPELSPYGEWWAGTSRTNVDTTLEISLVSPCVQINVTGNTTVYFKTAVLGNASVAVPKWSGVIRARRVR